MSSDIGLSTARGLALIVVHHDHIVARRHIILRTIVWWLHLVVAHLILRWIIVALWIHGVVRHALHSNRVALAHLLLPILAHWKLAHLRHHTVGPVRYLPHLLLRKLLEATHLRVVLHAVVLNMVINIWLLLFPALTLLLTFVHLG